MLRDVIPSVYWAVRVPPSAAGGCWHLWGDMENPCRPGGRPSPRERRGRVPAQSPRVCRRCLAHWHKPPATGDLGPVVYAVNGSRLLAGFSYHVHACSELRPLRPRRLPLAVAQALGLRACLKCKPPTKVLP